MKCKKHNVDMQCMAGCSAHPDNWYCEQCDEEESTRPVYMFLTSTGQVARFITTTPLGVKVANIGVVPYDEIRVAKPAEVQAAFGS